MDNLNNDPRLDKLDAGRDFAVYLIDNGWNITMLEIYPSLNHLFFVKENAKIEYYCTDKGSTF